MSEPTTYTEEQFRAAVDAAGQTAFEESYREAIEAARATGHAEGFPIGVAQERERCRAILEGPSAATHPKLTLHLVRRTDMTPDEVTQFLAGLPPERPHRDRMDECIASAEAAAASAKIDAVGAGLNAAVTRLLKTNREAVN